MVIVWDYDCVKLRMWLARIRSELQLTSGYVKLQGNIKSHALHPRRSHKVQLLARDSERSLHHGGVNSRQAYIH